MCGIIKKSDTKINIRTIERFDWLRALSKVNVYEKGFHFIHLLLKPFHATGLFLCPLSMPPVVSFYASMWHEMG